MAKTITAEQGQVRLTVGIDLGDRYSEVCVLDDAAEVVEEARIRMTPEALARRFESLEPCLVALEQVLTHPG